MTDTEVCKNWAAVVPLVKKEKRKKERKKEKEKKRKEKKERKKRKKEMSQQAVFLALKTLGILYCHVAFFVPFRFLAISLTCWPSGAMRGNVVARSAGGMVQSGGAAPQSCRMALASSKSLNE